MRIPALSIDRPDDPEAPVRFRTEDGRLEGTAWLEPGCGESHYEVADVARVSLDIEPSVRATSTDAELLVVADVVMLFEDDVAVAAAHGWDFWIGGDERSVALAVGDRVRFRVRELTLYCQDSTEEPAVADGVAPVAPSYGPGES